jgi:hypothetical protein
VRVLSGDEGGVEGAECCGWVGQDGGGEQGVAGGEAAEAEGDAVVLGWVGLVEEGGDVLLLVVWGWGFSGED